MEDKIKAELTSSNREFVISMIPDLSSDLKTRCDLVDILIKSPFGNIHGKSELSMTELKDAMVLETLLSSLESSQEWTVWGLGNYRSEGPFMKCNFQGDGLGHFKVTIKLSEDNMEFKDEFTTDQTCIQIFLEDIRKMIGFIEDRIV